MKVIITLLLFFPLLATAQNDSSKLVLLNPPEVITCVWPVDSNDSSYYNQEILELEILEDSLVDENDKITQEFDGTLENPIHIKAKFPGGEDKLNEFIQNNSPKSKCGSMLKETNYTSFTIKQDGTLTNFRTRKGINTEIDESIIEMLKKMPNWIPTKENGNPIDSEYIIPIKL
jgi:hypothetical protein